MILALPFLLALLVSAAAVPVCRAVALRLGYTAPAAPWQAGRRPKALFGGVGLALSLFGCAMAIGAFGALPVLLLCGAAIFLLGTATDLFTLKPYTKLIGVIAVASVFLFFDYRLHWTESMTLDGLFTLFWIVGITSAFNLLDNMDGLCAGIAVIAGTAFLVTLAGEPTDSSRLLQMQYLAVLLGAIAGFLIYNVYPASVVMGDAGSLLVGVNMAAMTLEIAPGRGSDLLSIIAVPVVLLLIPILDVIVVALSRLTVPRPSAPEEQRPHRLIAMGLSERRAVGLLWLLSAVSGIVGVVADRSPQFSSLLVPMFTIGVALCAVYLARVRVHETTDPERLPATITPLGVALGYRRRLAEMLLDLLLVSVAYYSAHRLMFTTTEWAERFESFFESFPIVLGIQMLALFVVGAYRGMWRYFSLNDGVTFAKGVFLGVVTSQVAVFYLRPMDRHPPALFTLHATLLLLFLVGSRASFRLISEYIHRQRQAGRRLLIYGADDAGATAVRHLTTDPHSAYRIIGFVDDDLNKRNIRLHGYRVIGGYDHLVGMVLAGEVDVVAVTHDNPALASLASLCASRGVTVYRLGLDWREVRAAGAVAAGGPVAVPQVEPRIVRFPEVRRPPEQTPGVVSGGAIKKVESFVAGSAAADGAKSIRVAHIITRLILGGAQENTLYTAIGQHRDPRFDVTLICGVDEAGEGNMFAEATRAGVRTVVLPPLLREIRPLTDLKALVRLYLILRNGSFDLVHTHSSKAGILGRVAARLAGVPVVIHTIHGVAFHEFQSAWKNNLYVALERLCAPLSDRIISVSQRLGEAAIARGIGRARQHLTVFSGIELDLFLSVRERLTVEQAKVRAGIPPGAPVVGKIARMFPLKGHAQFLEAAAAIARAVPEAYFLLVGDGPLRDELRRDAETLGIGDRLVMVGRVPPDMVPDYTQAMDVVVHTSLREGIARVLPQAGAVGKPVVTFDLDGAPEVVRDGTSGYLVPPLDTAAVARRVTELLEDEARRRTFGEAGRAFAAEHFSVERMVERINTLYLELVPRTFV